MSVLNNFASPWFLLLLLVTIPAVIALSRKSLAGLPPLRRWSSIALRVIIVLLLTLALAEEMLDQAGLDADPEKVLASGEARNTFEAMVAAQGGDLDAGLPMATHRETIAAPADGYVVALEAHTVGVAAWRLGAGRARKEDSVNPAAGVVCLVEPGTRVAAGDPVFEMHFDESERADSVRTPLAEAIELASEPVQRLPLVIDTIRSG